MENYVHHIKLYHEDEMRIREKAERSGMSVNAYIKSRALAGRTSRTIELPTVMEHTKKLDEVVREIRAITTSPHKDRMLYQSDLERIDRKLTELLQAEMQLVETVRR